MCVGKSQVIAGTYGISGYVDGAHPLFNLPNGVVFVDADQSLLVVDGGNKKIRRIKRTGK